LNYETSFAYDDLNRFTTCTDPFGKAVSYEYDAAGNRTKITYPGSKSVTYAYDSDNRLISVTDWLGGVTTYTYDSAGILQSSVNPNGTKTTYSYDASNRLIGLSNRKSNDTVIAGYTYTLDAVGNHALVVKDEPIAPEVTAADISYTYDDANRLSAAGGTTYTHDNRGNLTGTTSGNAYSFDYADRLTGVTIGGQTIQYLYDGLGNRIARTEGGVQTRYILDLNGPMSQVLAETDSSGNVTNYYVYGHGLISKITTGGDRYCYHFDSRGSTVGMTDGSENVKNKYAYDEYGSVLNSSEANTNTNPFRYVGKYGVMDEGNGLLFMRARYYDSDTGRFLSKDPLRGELVDPGTLNRYVYVLGNPVMGVDPRGEFGLFTYITGGITVVETAGLIYESFKRIETYDRHLSFYLEKMGQLEKRREQGTETYRTMLKEVQWAQSKIEMEASYIRNQIDKAVGELVLTVAAEFLGPIFGKTATRLGHTTVSMLDRILHPNRVP
jgi:RHS repeat-associated protein